MIRSEKDLHFMKIAKLLSQRATCPRRAVGCIIVNKYGHTMATGYNGVPRGFDHCTDVPCGGEKEKDLDSCLATHAEQNALMQCKDIMDIETIYTTTAPCITCAKLIANTSCKRLIYSNHYSDKALDILRKAKIELGVVHFITFQ